MKRFELCRALRSAGLGEYAERIVRAADALEASLGLDSAVEWMDGGWRRCGLRRRERQCWRRRGVGRG